jgi:hypothetical protein
MILFLRWLAFFVAGDLLMALCAAVAAAICGLVAVSLGAVWDASVDATMARALFAVRLGDLPSPATALACLVLPGLFGAFWPSRRSLDNDGQSPATAG